MCRMKTISKLNNNEQILILIDLIVELQQDNDKKFLIIADGFKRVDSNFTMLEKERVSKRG